MDARTFTNPAGVRVEGPYENARNAASSDLFKRIIREVFGAKDVIIAHHLTYARDDKDHTGFAYETIEEIPSADTLIFDHEIAKTIWGEAWQANLVKLVLEPCESRDDLLAQLYNARTPRS